MATINKTDCTMMERSEADDESLEEEIELLEAIYINELTVRRTEDGRPCHVSLLLHPATGENVEEQYVCLTLDCSLSAQYPFEVPDMVIKNPRGLADEHVSSLRQELHRVAEERKGNPMLYELIELAKESLTQGNVPHGQCVVCLEDFVEGDTFTKTICYHYFHCGCLLRYIEHSQRELDEARQEAERHRHLAKDDKGVVCPVCRESITYDLEALQQQGQMGGEEDRYEISAEIRQLQRRMAALYAKQQAKGGIIDLEEEQNKHLISQGEEVVIPFGGVQSQLSEHSEPRKFVSQGVGHRENSRGQGRGRGRGRDINTDNMNGHHGSGSRGRSGKHHQNRFNHDRKREKSTRDKHNKPQYNNSNDAHQREDDGQNGDYSDHRERRFERRDKAAPRPRAEDSYEARRHEDYDTHNGWERYEENDRAVPPLDSERHMNGRSDNSQSRRGHGRGRGRGSRWNDTARKDDRYWHDDHSETRSAKRFPQSRYDHPQSDMRGDFRKGEECKDTWMEADSSESFRGHSAPKHIPKSKSSEHYRDSYDQDYDSHRNGNDHYSARSKRGSYPRRSSSGQRFSKGRGQSVNGEHYDSTMQAKTDAPKRPPPGFSSAPSNKPHPSRLGPPPGFENSR